MYLTNVLYRQIFYSVLFYLIIKAKEHKGHLRHSKICTIYRKGVSVTEWLAYWTQAQKVPSSNRCSRILSGNSLRQTIHTHCAYVHQAAKIGSSPLKGGGQSLKTCLEARTCLENENPCLEKLRISASIFTSIFMLFYINIPFNLIVSDALRIAIKHECIFKNYFIVLFGCPINLI